MLTSIRYVYNVGPDRTEAWVRALSFPIEEPVALPSRNKQSRTKVYWIFSGFHVVHGVNYPCILTCEGFLPCVLLKVAV